ncbi:hypothetical protein EOL73_00080 [Candidatus Saccharibacteria bacterium]|nr:hypothetical protein [Candidatus Saccharibacteria bacterium]
MIQPSSVTPSKLDRVYLTEEAEFTSWLDTNTYVQVETDPVWAGDKPDYYTSSEVDSIILTQTNDVYTKTQIDDNFYTKTDVNSNFYTKVESDSMFLTTNLGVTTVVTNLLSLTQTNLMYFSQGLLVSNVVEGTP